MSLEIQDLEDLLRTLILIEAGKRRILKSKIKHRVKNICNGDFYIDEEEIDRIIRSMVKEGLVIDYGNAIKLTEKGAKIGSDWRNFLYKGEPVLEIIVGIADGSITSLIVIISSLIAGLTSKVALFASLVSLIVVALTNFSSFLLGGITEDLADLATLQNLITYSLSDISDAKERERALSLTKGIFNLLRAKRSRLSVYASLACGATTFLSGIIPLTVFLLLPNPIDTCLSLLIIGVMIGVFLVYYRSRKTRMPWKLILFQTALVIGIAVAISLLLGSYI